KGSLEKPCSSVPRIILQIFKTMETSSAPQRLMCLKTDVFNVGINSRPKVKCLVEMVVEFESLITVKKLLYKMGLKAPQTAIPQKQHKKSYFSLQMDRKLHFGLMKHLLVFCILLTI
uniref:Uncharacterized protein n=1 Tax=Poecilia reticulata TaxID=8081 RepID=A0A3P9PJG6_POERE